MYTPALFLFLYVVFVFYGLIKDKKNFIKLADVWFKLSLGSSCLIILYILKNLNS
jgi:hypothetical protein